MDIGRRNNLQPPERLVVQSDNTNSQAKNSETGMCLATLVGRKKFLSVLLSFLIVGRTHADIDQLFSVLLALVVRRHCFHTLDELVTEIQITMASVFTDRPEEVLAPSRAEVAPWTRRHVHRSSIAGIRTARIRRSPAAVAGRS